MSRRLKNEKWEREAKREEKELTVPEPSSARASDVRDTEQRRNRDGLYVLVLATGRHCTQVPAGVWVHDDGMGRAP